MGDLHFCEKCRNCLKPYELCSSKTLARYCETCGAVYEIDPSDELSHIVESVNINYKSVEDVKKHIYPGLTNDPTLPRDDDHICPFCGNRGAVYFLLPEYIAPEAMTMPRICTKCQKYTIPKISTASRRD